MDYIKQESKKYQNEKYTYSEIRVVLFFVSIIIFSSLALIARYMN